MKVINTWRKEVLNLPTRSILASEMVRSNGELVPVLYYYSPHVIPQPNDWPKNAIATGYWFLNSMNNWQPPADLVKFIAAGKPPVYIGFGSMTGQHPEQIAQIVIAALKKSKQRGIIATGWGGLAASDLPENIFKIESVPHDWLFPQMAAVVHHGGAGTTAAGLRAGKTTVICPFFGDQPFWGNRIAELGVGTKPIPIKQLTVDKLVDAINTAVSNENMRQRAANLGEKIRSEDGVARAVEIINNYLNFAPDENLCS